ncbi:MAG: hypothetical protein IRY99_06155 [Isosphaeraceae bacterium]|nr:hypothetical protein [Isosphaeraceae bacterium]
MMETKAMSGVAYEALSDRLDRLEQENDRLRRDGRRRRFWGQGVAVGLAVLCLAGAQAVKEAMTIEASHFVLRDKEGRMRAALAIRPDGTPGLGFFDEKGAPRLSLELGSDGAPSVSLLAPGGTPQAALAIRPDGTPGLGLFDAQGKVRLSLDIQPQGAPGVNLLDGDGTLRGALAIRPDGTPGLGLFDEEGQIDVSLDGKPEGQARPTSPPR